MKMKSAFGGNTETKDSPFEKFDNDEKQRNGESVGYTIRNLAQKCIDYLEQIE